MTENGDSPSLESERPTTTSGSTGLAWGVVLLLIGFALIAVFAVQNTDPVTIRFLWLERNFPLSIVILVVIVAAVLLTELVAVLYRRRRRKGRAEKEELRRLREE